MLKQLILTARLHLHLGRITIILMEMVVMKIVIYSIGNTVSSYRIFSVNLKLKSQQTLMRSFFGRLLKGQQLTSQITTFLADRKLIMDKKQILKRCGLTALRHWVPLRLVFNMITIFLPMLLLASKICLTPVQKTYLEF